MKILLAVCVAAVMVSGTGCLAQAESNFLDGSNFYTPAPPPTNETHQGANRSIHQTFAPLMSNNNAIKHGTMDFPTSGVCHGTMSVVPPSVDSYAQFGRKAIEMPYDNAYSQKIKPVDPKSYVPQTYQHEEVYRQWNPVPDSSYNPLSTFTGPSLDPRHYQVNPDPIVPVYTPPINMDSYTVRGW